MGAAGLRGCVGAGGIGTRDARRGCAGFCRRLTVQGICTEWFERCGRGGLCRRLTVQGINSGWFERYGRAGLCRRLTVPGINTGRSEPRGWTGCRWPLRRAVGGGSGSQVGLVAVEGDVDPADAEQGEAVAVVGARVGTVAVLAGAGVAQPDMAPGPPPRQALGRARAGAAPAVHAATEFAVDRAGAVRAAAAGVGILRADCAGMRPRFGLPRGLLAMGGGRRKASGLAGAAAVRAAYGIPVPGSMSNK
jgi:hypothetical protein